MDTDPRLQRQISYGHDAVVTAMRCVPLLKASAADKHAVYALTLHATITELFAGCLALAEAQRAAGIPILLRAIFEALVDLDNLLRDAAYARHMDASNLVGILNLLDAALTNPLLAGIGDLHDIPTHRSDCRAELDELQASNHRPLKIFERCKRVGREDQYRSVYGLVCLDAHNNVTALVDRHVEVGPDGSIVAVSFFVEDDPAMTRRRLDLAAGFFVEAAGMIHAAFKTGAPQIEALEAGYAAQHAAVVADAEADRAARKARRAAKSELQTELQ